MGARPFFGGGGEGATQAVPDVSVCVVPPLPPSVKQPSY